LLLELRLITSRRARKIRHFLEELHLTDKKVIVCVGRLVHRKGQDRLIEAMPKILESIPDAALLLVGEGPYRAKLDGLVAKNHLQQNVHFVGRLHYGDLPRYLRLGDIFAMPSRARLFGLEVEGLGIVYLEASSAGIPVLGGAQEGHQMPFWMARLDLLLMEPISMRSQKKLLRCWEMMNCAKRCQLVAVSGRSQRGVGRSGALASKRFYLGSKPSFRACERALVLFVTCNFR